MPYTNEKITPKKLYGTNILNGECNFKHPDGVHCDEKRKDGSYGPARPLGYVGFLHRVSCAWLVLSGKADIMVWPN